MLSVADYTLCTGFAKALSERDRLHFFAGITIALLGTADYTTYFAPQADPQSRAVAVVATLLSHLPHNAPTGQGPNAPPSPIAMPFKDRDPHPCAGEAFRGRAKPQTHSFHRSAFVGVRAYNARCRPDFRFGGPTFEPHPAWKL